MTATAGTTTIEVPIPLRDRLAQHRIHPRQAYHEVIGAALDALEVRQRAPGLDPLVTRHRRELRREARRCRLQRIWLYGSRARADARPDADVDILYKTGPGATLWDIAGFQAAAQALLGARVDVADIDAMPEEMRQRAMPDVVVI